jgi:hypothetical protein
MFAFVMLLIMELTVSNYHALDGLITIQKQPLQMALPPDNAFLAFRAALFRYIEAHPETSGNVPLGALGLEASVAAGLKDAGDSVSISGSMLTIESWAAMSQADILKTITRAQGDLSIGSAQGATWSTPHAGPMGSLPTAVATGHVVSLITISKGSL